MHWLLKLLHITSILISLARTSYITTTNVRTAGRLEMPATLSENGVGDLEIFG